MIKRKQEIILSQEVTSLSEFRNLIKKNIFPLCIYLNDNEKEEVKDQDIGFRCKIENDNLINELYPVYNLENYVYLDSYALRKKIENGEVYVNKFLDDSKKVMHVRFIAPAIGFDLDCPKVVFRKTPRFIFKTMDHFSIDAKYEGEEILSLCCQLAFEDKEQKRLVK